MPSPCGVLVRGRLAPAKEAPRKRYHRYMVAKLLGSYLAMVTLEHIMQMLIQQNQQAQRGTQLAI